MNRGLAFVLAPLLCLGAAGPGGRPRLTVWRWEEGRLSGPSDGPLAVGSLQKPFVAKAWAAAHPAEATPRFRCAGGAECWFKPGHGELGLSRALALSCNAYFRRLAQAAPADQLAATFQAEGFAPLPSTPEEAIGLPGPKGLVRIRPSALLEAYRRLVRTPWPLGEAARGEVLAGLHEAALIGTARGLDARSGWAKTGTVPAAPGDELHTIGFALVLDEPGPAALARLAPGTGREAAAALAEAWHRPFKAPTPAPSVVTVRLFELLHPRRCRVKNVGPAPIPAGKGFLGPGSDLELRPGDRVGPGLLEISLPASGMRRRLEGEVRRLSGKPDRLVARLSPRAYTEGVLAAELPQGSPELRVELAAAVLRFLAQGRRHVDADVCDSTHCAWFVGRGPRLDWRDAHHAAEVGGPEPEPLPESAWIQALAASKQPGPSLWTGHCGGRPLSPQALWGRGETAIYRCPRHGSGPTDPWTRVWRAGDLAKAFGGPVEGLDVREARGVWELEVRRGGTLRGYSYDEAHRRLAAALGWDALPSPADRVEPTAEGYRAMGVGRGHRVGLCLGE